MFGVAAATFELRLAPVFAPTADFRSNAALAELIGPAIATLRDQFSVSLGKDDESVFGYPRNKYQYQPISASETCGLRKWRLNRRDLWKCPAVPTYEIQLSERLESSSSAL